MIIYDSFRFITFYFSQVALFKKFLFNTPYPVNYQDAVKMVYLVLKCPCQKPSSSTLPQPSLT
ncbi:MAG: hypothetical protein L0958_06345, partial [Candidatus Mariimomonas ferrooxydans]